MILSQCGVTILTIKFDQQTILRLINQISYFHESTKSNEIFNDIEIRFLGFKINETLPNYLFIDIRFSMLKEKFFTNHLCFRMIATNLQLRTTLKLGCLM